MISYKQKIKLGYFALILSAFTLVAYHIPFFRYVLDNVEGGFNTVMIVTSLALLMLALDFFFYYLVLFVGRMVGKILLAVMFIANALSFYFITTYDTFLTAKMMGNVFNTRYSEASGFFSGTLVLYLLIFGVIPVIYLFLQHVDYGRWKRFLANIGISLALCLGIALANMTNWPWIDKNSSTMGSLLMPWSYTVNSIRWWNSEKNRNRKEILLPDATISSDRKDVCVLIIGESARRANFSLYGYGRNTNPLLERDSVTALIADADATYTTAGVKAILDHKSTGKLYEILPNYLNRAGVDVTWRTNNWGEPPVHISKYYTVKDIKEMYPDASDKYDGILLEGLSEAIRGCDNDKMLIIIHTNTSHGPTYYQKYPSEFEVFKPVCTTVEMSKANREELINAYDNSILYTDWLVHNVIDTLKDIPERRSCVIYVSDHGESLGENNLYMHGVPMSMAPKVQTEIPFIVWTSDKSLKIDPDLHATQYHVFHSILDFLDIDSPIYNPELDIFEKNQEPVRQQEL